MLGMLLRRKKHDVTRLISYNATVAYHGEQQGRRSLWQQSAVADFTEHLASGGLVLLHTCPPHK